MTQCPYAPDSSPESEAATIIRNGIPRDNSSCHSVGCHRPNAYVFREMDRLVIIPQNGHGGWLIIDLKDIAGDIAPGH